MGPSSLIRPSPLLGPSPPNDVADNPPNDEAVDVEPVQIDENNPCGLTDDQLAFLREAPVEEVAQAVVDGVYQVYEFTKTLGKCTRAQQISRKVKALRKQIDKDARTLPAPKYRVLSEKMYWVKKLIKQNHLWNIHQSWEGIDNGVKANDYDTTITDVLDLVVEWVMKENVEATVSERFGMVLKCQMDNDTRAAIITKVKARRMSAGLLPLSVPPVPPRKRKTPESGGGSQVPKAQRVTPPQVPTPEPPTPSPRNPSVLITLNQQGRQAQLAQPTLPPPQPLLPISQFEMNITPNSGRVNNPLYNQSGPLSTEFQSKY